MAPEKKPEQLPVSVGQIGVIVERPDGKYDFGFWRPHGVKIEHRDVGDAPLYSYFGGCVGAALVVNIDRKTPRGVRALLAHIQLPSSVSLGKSMLDRERTLIEHPGLEAERAIDYIHRILYGKNAPHGAHGEELHLYGGTGSESPESSLHFEEGEESHLMRVVREHAEKKGFKPVVHKEGIGGHGAIFLHYHWSRKDPRKRHEVRRSRR